jgi:hypothetical protein
VPSGASYVLTNRRAISAALSEAFTGHRIRPVGAYSRRLLDALRASAPAGVDDPTVVVLTTGFFNGACFEHALLARTMGIELVEGRDLVCQRGRVMMRTTKGLEQVHVIYRRVDDDFLDPVHFRADSLLGCPGLMNAARAGNVTIANAVDNEHLAVRGRRPPRGGPRPARRAAAQAGRRLRRQGHLLGRDHVVDVGRRARHSRLLTSAAPHQGCTRILTFSSLLVISSSKPFATMSSSAMRPVMNWKGSTFPPVTISMVAGWSSA